MVAALGVGGAVAGVEAALAEETDGAAALAPRALVARPAYALSFKDKGINIK